MKKHLTTLAVVLCTLALSGKLLAQDFQTKSLNHAGSEEMEFLSDIAFDNQGNYYVVGSYSGDMEFKTNKFDN
jgi:hypothetical protein